VDSIAIRSTRAGQPTVSASAMFDPQSCPATEKRSIPSASASAIASSARVAELPVRAASADRNRVSPKPRSVGVTVRSPAAVSAGMIPSQVDGSSGQPWSNNTTGPSCGPSSR
jgi:hypothetical protein